MEEGVGQFPSPHRPWTVQASRVNQPPKKTTPKRNNAKKNERRERKKKWFGQYPKSLSQTKMAPPLAQSLP